MVKGISRQVIVVRQPDTRLFEQAIFFLRDDALGREGVSDQQVLREACRVADQYVRARTQKKPRRPLGAARGFALGAFAVGLAWLLATIL